MKHVGQYLEIAYLRADASLEGLKQVAGKIKRFNCRKAIAHMADAWLLTEFLPEERIQPVIDFPYGRGGEMGKAAGASTARAIGFSGAEVCVDLRSVCESRASGLVSEIMCLSGIFSESREEFEVKAIIQLPYLWQYAKSRIEPLIKLLPDCGVKAVKDWTGVVNFSRPMDLSDLALETRLQYLDFVRNIVDKHSLPLLIKIAGEVRAENAVEFVKRGADILEVDIYRAPSVYYELLEALP